MKKILLIASLLTLILIAAGPKPPKLVRLTVVNKSGLPLEISLTGSCEDNYYYLRVPEGDRLFPTKKVFTVAPDMYSARLYYIELWDPVYGYSCSSKSQQLDVRHNTRVMVLECDRTPACPGETSIVKFGAGRRTRVR